MRFMADMVEAVELGMKRVTRRIIGPGNSFQTRGTFKDVDPLSCHPDRVEPVWGLVGRVERPGGPFGERRSAVICPQTWAGDLLWMQFGNRARKTAPETLLVQRITAGRVQDINEEEALAEGVEIFGVGAGAAMVSVLDCAYWRLLAKLTAGEDTRWRKSELHHRVERAGATARDCFALLWATINGPSSWARNPWVWCYEFKTLELSPAEAIEQATQLWRQTK